MLEPNLRRPLLNTEIRRRGIYLLPNLFTTAALFAGFYAIVMAMNQRFDNAAVAIFVAMILDTLDGRVARLTHTQSAFGAEYDSLSDMVAGFLWLASDNKIPVDDYGVPWVAAFLTLYAGLTMVSNVPFYSFKDINLRRSVPFTVILVIVLCFILISTDPPIVLFLLFVAYGLSGYVYWLWKKRRPRDAARLQ